MIRAFMVGYSSHKGGVETYIDNLCSKFNKEKYEIIYSMPEMVVDGRVYKRPSSRHNYFKYRAFWINFLRENKIDVVYYNTCDIVTIDILKFAKIAGVPIRIIHAHSSGIQQNVNLFQKICERFNHKTLYKYATDLFACSDVAGKWMFDDRPFTVIKNGISIDKFAFDITVRDKLRKSIGVNDELLIGMVGRISKVKNPSFAIDVLKNIVDKKNNAKLIFVGDGELMDDTKQLVYKKSMNDNTVFLGSVENVNEWLSAFDVLIMPSLFEGLPFVLIEAQANGLNCLVSDAVTKDADLTGLLQFVSLDNTSEWADKVLSITNEHRVDTAKMLIEGGYSIENTANEVMSIIEGKL